MQIADPDSPTPTLLRAGATGPLAGIVIADFSRVLAGPYSTMLLADLGATVIKVESKLGDETRSYRPPVHEGESTYFLSINRNKQSIVLDFADPEDLRTARRIASQQSGPLREGIAVFDLVTGMHAAIGTLSALHHRERTGEGEIVIAVGNTAQFERLCAVLGAPKIANDPRFATNGERSANREQLRPLLPERFATRSAAEWFDELRAVKEPCALILVDAPCDAADTACCRHTEATRTSLTIDSMQAIKCNELSI